MTAGYGDSARLGSIAQGIIMLSCDSGSRKRLLRKCNRHPGFSGEMEDRFGQHGGVCDALLTALFQGLIDKEGLAFGGAKIAA